MICTLQTSIKKLVIHNENLKMNKSSIFSFLNFVSWLLVQKPSERFVVKLKKIIFFSNKIALVSPWYSAIITQKSSSCLFFFVHLNENCSSHPLHKTSDSDKCPVSELLRTQQQLKGPIHRRKRAWKVVSLIYSDDVEA